MVDTPPLTLGKKRQIFTHNIATLIIWGNTQGFNLALDQVKRTQIEANANAASGSGIVNSLHLLGLAADILLYDNNGKYVTDGSFYTSLGDFWKGLHELNRWGGDFITRKDSDHFSMFHEGVE